MNVYFLWDLPPKDMNFVRFNPQYSYPIKGEQSRGSATSKVMEGTFDQSFRPDAGFEPDLNCDWVKCRAVHSPAIVTFDLLQKLRSPKMLAEALQSGPTWNVLSSVNLKKK
jgi:hypothetical protein